MAGFFLASQGRVDWSLLAATLAGTALIIGSACVVNNCLDREIDAKMDRTKNRALAAGTVSIRSALVYGAVLSAGGFGLLLLAVNALTAAIGLVGFLAYTLLYSFAKRRSHHGTLVGTVSGATPPVAGYVAVTNHLDSAALLLFLVLVCWQMPHFYAIAMYRFKDYKAAGLPVLPVAKGMRRTRFEITAYVVGFITANSLLTVFGYTSYVFAAVMAALGFVWLYLGQKFSPLPDKAWGRTMFFYSLVVILIFSAALALDSFLT